jgi:hypothetical protein
VRRSLALVRLDDELGIVLARRNLVALDLLGDVTFFTTLPCAWPPWLFQRTVSPA